jgi:hypothetical protein
MSWDIVFAGIAGFIIGVVTVFLVLSIMVAIKVNKRRNTPMEEIKEDK